MVVVARSASHAHIVHILARIFGRDDLCKNYIVIEQQCYYTNIFHTTPLRRQRHINESLAIHIYHPLARAPPPQAIPLNRKGKLICRTISWVEDTLISFSFHLHARKKKCRYVICARMNKVSTMHSCNAFSFIFFYPESSVCVQFHVIHAFSIRITKRSGLDHRNYTRNIH